MPKDDAPPVRVAWRAWWFVAVDAAVVLLVLVPAAGTPGLSALLPLATAPCAAVAIDASRRSLRPRIDVVQALCVAGCVAVLLLAVGVGLAASFHEVAGGVALGAAAVAAATVHVLLVTTARRQRALAAA